MCGGTPTLLPYMSCFVPSLRTWPRQGTKLVIGELRTKTLEVTCAAERERERERERGGERERGREREGSNFRN